jgi:histone deacetylase HOS3
VEEAQRLYDAKYSHLLQKAQNFFSKTDSSPESSLILISAGFDACTHETPGMQRHGKNVPPQFYEVFTRDAVAMADKYCAGKCVSILEGGYSDRALTSGAIAHLIGLGVPGISEELYQSSNLYQLEKVAKMASSGQQRRKTDALTKEGVWLEYAMEALRRLDEMCGKKRAVASITAPVTPSRAMLDELWKSPRETRRGGGAGMKPSPIK